MTATDRDSQAFRNELKRRMAQRYLEERGLKPIAIGCAYARPYTPPEMGRDAEQLQRILLIKHD
jgi:hypothetical protein